MRSKSLRVLAGGIAVVCLITAAEAAIVTQALYRCGELGDDPNASLLASVGTDATRSSFNGTKSIQDVLGATNPRPAGSTKWLQNSGTAWTPGLAYMSGTANNWGMSAWIKMPDVPLAGVQYQTDSLWVMSNGTYNANAIGINRVSGVDTWSNGHGNIAAVSSSLYGTWAHVALVYNGNTNAEFYVNGVKLGATASNAAFRSDSAGHLWIGTHNANSNTGRGAKGYDEIQVFSFNPGEFQISDVYSAVPEPHGLAISAAVGCVGLAFRRRASRLGR